MWPVETFTTGGDQCIRFACIQRLKSWLGPETDRPVLLKAISTDHGALVRLIRVCWGVFAYWSAFIAKDNCRQDTATTLTPSSTTVVQIVERQSRICRDGYYMLKMFFFFTSAQTMCPVLNVSASRPEMNILISQRRQRRFKMCL